MAKAEAKEAAAQAATETRWRVIVNSDNRPGGDKPITLTVKGQVNHVPRDTEVYLTKAQLGVLQDSRIRGYETVGETGVRAVAGRNRFSYVILGQVEVPTGTVSPEPLADQAAEAKDGEASAGEGDGGAAS